MNPGWLQLLADRRRLAAVARSDPSGKFYQFIHFVMSDPITENSGMSVKSFGPEVEVLKPVKLREQIAEMIGKIAGRYEGGNRERSFETAFGRLQT
jgi:predicted DNA-binding transcriptional regulator YafY